MVGQHPISSFLDTYESGDLPSIPERQAIHCCCGDQACAYLQHNEKALSGLERDVRTAAQIGKVSSIVYCVLMHLPRGQYHLWCGSGGVCICATDCEPVVACMQRCEQTWP